MKPCKETEEGIIREVIKYIKKKYDPKDSNLDSVSWERYEPHTPEWRQKFYTQNAKCGFGFSSMDSLNKPKIYLTRYEDCKAS